MCHFVILSLQCVVFLFFSLELFHRNSGNKDLVFSWCSDVASGVGWTLPPFVSAGNGVQGGPEMKLRLLCDLHP